MLKTSISRRYLVDKDIKINITASISDIDKLSNQEVVKAVLEVIQKDLFADIVLAITGELPKEEESVMVVMKEGVEDGWEKHRAYCKGCKTGGTVDLERLDSLPL